MYEGNRAGITGNEIGVVSLDKIEDKVTPKQITEEFQWAVDIFPALHKYKNDHNITNLQKLCLEVVEFCRNIYASTKSDEERQVYRRMFEKLNK